MHNQKKFNIKNVEINISIITSRNTIHELKINKWFALLEKIYKGIQEKRNSLYYDIYIYMYLYER